MPNFVLLDTATGEDWWADVLANPRARKRNWRIDKAISEDSYRFSDELRPVILVACSKCDWWAAFVAMS